MAMRAMKMSKAEAKRRFIASLTTASMGKLVECETTLRVTLGKARAGEQFAADLAELHELLAAVLAAKSKL